MQVTIAIAAMGYDALGRKTSEQSNWTTRTWAYDATGRRTKLDWGDGLFVTYDYDPTGAMTAIRENGAGVLVSFDYDDLGRRTSLMRANGTVTSYGYDAASRLGSLSFTGGNQPNACDPEKQAGAFGAQGFCAIGAV